MNFKNFWRANDRIFTRILKKNNYSYFVACLIFLISKLQILGGQFSAFKHVTKNTESSIEVVITSFTFLDSSKFLDIPSFIFFAMFYCGVFFLIGLIAIYLFLMYNSTDKKAMKNTRGNIFSKSCLYSIWILQYPLQTIFFSFLFCRKEIMDQMGIACYDNTFHTSFSAVGLVLNTVISIWISIFYFKTPLETKDYLSTFYESILFFYTVIRAISPLFRFVPPGIIAKVFFYIFHLSFSFFLYIFHLIKNPWSKSAFAKYANIFPLFYLAQTLGFLIGDLFRINYEKAQSLYFIVIIFVVLWVLYFNFKRMIFEYYICLDDKRIKNYFGIMNKIRLIQIGGSSLDPIAKLYMKGYFKLHIVSCEELNCFCKKKSIYDPKRDRDFDLSKAIYQISTFSKFFIMSIMEKYLSKFRSLNLQIFYCEYLFEKFRYVARAIWETNKLKIRFLNPVMNFKFFRLNFRISDFTKKVNDSSFKGFLPFEKALYVDDKLIEILEEMKDNLEASIENCAILEKKFISLEEVNVNLHNWIVECKNINKKWKPLLEFAESKRKIRFYNNWFKKNILNLKMKIVDEEFSKNIGNQIDLDNKSVNSEDFISTILDDKSVFEHQNAVIHISGNKENFCHITKCSKSVIKYFGYSCEELIGTNVSILMPNFIAKLHNSFVKKYTNTGFKNIIGKQKYVYALDKSNLIVPMWLMIKQSVSIEGNIEFLGMMKQIKSKQFRFSYALLNEFGEIEGMTAALFEKIFEKSPDFISEKINILIFAPKLVRKMYTNVDIKSIKSEKIELSLIDSPMHKRNSLTTPDGGERKFSNFRNPERKLTKTNSQINITSKLKNVISSVKMNLASNNHEKKESSDDSSSEEESNIEGAKRVKFSFQMRIPDELPLYMAQLKQIFAEQFSGLEANSHSGSVFTNKTNKTARKKSHMDTFNISNYVKILLEMNTKIHRSGKYTIYNVRAILKPYTISKSIDPIKILKIISIKKTTEKFQTLAKNNVELLKAPRGSIPINNPYNRRMPLLAINSEMVDKNLDWQRSSNAFGKSFDDYFSKSFSMSEKDNEKLENYYPEEIENIFLKDENLMPKNTLSAINRLKWFLRVLFIVIFIMNFLVYILGVYIEIPESQENVQKQFSSSKLQLSLNMIEENYLDFSLVRDNKLKTLNKTSYIENIILNLASYDNTIFKEINPDYEAKLILQKHEFDNKFTKDIQTNSGNISMQYLFIFRIVKYATNFAYKNIINNSYVNSSLYLVGFEPVYEHNFPTVNNFLVEKNKLSTIGNDDNFSRIILNQLIMYAVQEGVILISILFFIRIFLYVIRTFQIIVEIFTDISRNSVEYMKYYFIALYNSFISMLEREKVGLTTELERINRYEYKRVVFKGEEDDINVKKAKVVESGSLLKSYKKRIIRNYLFILLAASIICGSKQLYIYLKVERLRDINSDGEKIFNIASTTNTIILSYKSLLYNETKYREEFKHFYLTLSKNIDEMRNAGQIRFSNSDFSSIRFFKDHFFGSGCQFIGNNTEKQECEQILTGRLKEGFISFISYVTYKLEGKVMLSNENKFGNITNSEILELTTANRIYTKFLETAISKWNNEIMSELNEIYSFAILILIFVEISTIILFVFTEINITGVNQKKYKEYKKIYMNFMPNLVISKERISRAKLVLAGILNK